MKKTLQERKDVVFLIKLSPLRSHPAAYEKAKAIVCEKSLSLLEEAYEKKALPKPSCETSAIDENMRLMETLGISGLPFMILPDGRGFPGYRDAKALMNLIGK